MNRLSQKLLLLRLSLITKLTRQPFSFNLLRWFLPTIRLCRSLARHFLIKTLAIFPATASMDDDFFSSGDDNNYLINYDFDRRPTTSFLFTNDDATDGELLVDKLYLVPYRWWIEVQSGVDHVGVRYDVSSDNTDETEMVLCLRKEDDSSVRNDCEEGFSGRQYALLSGSVWSLALKRHSDSRRAVNEVNSHFVAEDDVFPLQIRLSVSYGTNSLIVKICMKENAVDYYRKACNIFESNTTPLHIWDFSGQTSQLLMNDRIKFCNGSIGQFNPEILLELQVHGFSNFMEDRDEEHNVISGLNEKGTSTGCNSANKMNTNCMNSYSRPYPMSAYGCRRVGFLGLTGLQNLGNTCFMNSTIQCLTHTPELVDYFLGDFTKEINYENPLGMKGELALAFGDLLRKLWAPGATSVAPRLFKIELAKFAPRFSGYNQHDAQEFLAFLLDGLHEDLNRVRHKPYFEIKEVDDRPDKLVAEEYWQNHLARNNSIIVDLCQGQYRSTLICPVCKKKSVTFDPFMYLSLPLPSTTMRTMTLTILSDDGKNLPHPITVTVPKCGILRDLIEALSVACSLTDSETLLIAEIYRNRVFSFLDDPSGSLALIRDSDTLVAYRLPKDDVDTPLVVFMHQRVEQTYEFGKVVPSRKLFGIPLVTRLSDISNGLDLHKKFLKLLEPFLMPADDALNDYDDVEIAEAEDSLMEDVLSPTISESHVASESEVGLGSDTSSDFQFLEGEDGQKIIMNEPVLVPKSGKKLEVYVLWSAKMIEQYDTCLLSSLSEVFKSQIYTWRPQESVSLYKCLEAFLKEEPLGPDDMWYCPSCRKPRQAIKKLDLWRLPEILVVHLKRFSYSRVLKNKLETYVDFPSDNLDLSSYISHSDDQFSNHYELYAISNHYGGMGGGHYTAFVDNGCGNWFEFDDDRVFPVGEDKIRTSAAYVLFYRRVS